MTMKEHMRSSKAPAVQCLLQVGMLPRCAGNAAAPADEVERLGRGVVSVKVTSATCFLSVRPT